MTKRKMLLHKDQQGYLQGRLRDAERDKDPYDRSEPKPPAVRAAERIIEAHQESCNKRRTARKTTLRKRVNEVREKILFGTEIEALAAVKAFEAWQPQ